MSFDWEAPEEFAQGGNFLDTPGTYHALIQDVKTTDKEGKVLDGFRVEFVVLDGTVRNEKGCTEVDKKFSVMFHNGKASSKDGGRFSRQKQAAIFVAGGVFDSAAEVSKAKESRSINIEKMRNGQVVVTLDKREYEDEKKNKKSTLDIHFTNIFHIDDPAANAFPKNQKLIGLLPKSRRRTAAELQSIKDAFGGKKSNDDESNATKSVSDMTEGL